MLDYSTFGESVIWCVSAYSRSKTTTHRLIHDVSIVKRSFSNEYNFTLQALYKKKKYKLNQKVHVSLFIQANQIC